MTYFGNRGLWRQASFRPETKALIARMSPTPSRPRQIVINRLITSLIRDGVWAKLDVLQVYAADAQANALLNWVSSSYNSTAVGSPTFTTDRGFTFNGTTQYLNTAYTPSTAALYAQNSHTLGRWLRSGASGNVGDIGARETATNKGATIASNAGGGAYTIVESGVSSSQATSPTANILLTRSAAGSFDIYKSGAFVANVTASSIAPPTIPVFVGALNLDSSADSLSANQYSAAYAGAALSAGEVLALQNALQAYMTAVGA